VTDAPGLGVELDRAALERLKARVPDAAQPSSVLLFTPLMFVMYGETLMKWTGRDI
jgi:hypothetical protein